MFVSAEHDVQNHSKNGVRPIFPHPSEIPVDWQPTLLEMVVS